MLIYYIISLFLCCRLLVRIFWTIPHEVDITVCQGKRRLQSYKHWLGVNFISCLQTVYCHYVSTRFVKTPIVSGVLSVRTHGAYISVIALAGQHWDMAFMMQETIITRHLKPSLQTDIQQPCAVSKQALGLQDQIKSHCWSSAPYVCTLSSLRPSIFAYDFENLSVCIVATLG